MADPPGTHGGAHANILAPIPTWKVRWDTREVAQDKYDEIWNGRTDQQEGEEAETEAGQ